MTSQLIDLVNTTNNIVYENLKKLNSKFHKIQKNLITNEESQYDSLNSKISIYFTTFIEQMKTKFILAIRKYEKQIQQNNKDIIELIMDNMLLKLEKDELKQKELKRLDEYNTDIAFQKTKNSINTNIIKNLNNIKKYNNINNVDYLLKKKSNQKNVLNNGLYSFNNNEQNKNNVLSINNFNLLDIFNTNKSGSKKKKKTNSCNKFNNNNYNFNFITGSRLDLNRYYSRNKTNISYNSLGKNIFGSQENLNFQKNKNSFSLKDFRKNKKSDFNKNKSKKSSSKKNVKHLNYINDENYMIDNYKCKKRTNYDNNKIQIITEPSFQENNKNKDKLNFYCIKQMKDEMNEILKNKKNNNDNNYNLNINEPGNIIDNQINNKIKLPMGYNYYYSKNKLNNNNINTSTNNNKKKSKNNINNKNSKPTKPSLHENISESLNTDKYKDAQYKINYTISNINTNNQNRSRHKLSKYPTHMYNNHSNSNILDNFSINTNKKNNCVNNNFDSSILKNLKKISLFNNISNSKSCYKLNISKKGNINNTSTHKKKYLNLNNNESYNDNINNNISYNLRNKGMSRNYSNYGTNINNNTYYLNNNYKTINNFNKVSSVNNISTGQIININKSNNIENNRIVYTNISDNSINTKIKNKINMKNQNNNLKININNINDIGKNNNLGNNNISTNYLMNNNNNKEKMDIKKIMFSSEESNKNETPSFYLFKK